MEKRKLANTEVEVSVVTFGAWAIGGWMWGGADQKDAIEAIHAALDHDISSIDTAPVYGFGLSEELVGKALEGKKREQVQVLTKYGLRWDTDKGNFKFASQNAQGEAVNIQEYAGKESVIKECEDSLRRLKTDYIDLYQIHWPDPTTPIEETMEAVQQLLQQGKIRAAGVCNYNVDQVSEALKYAPIVSNQVPYSMVNRGIEADVMPQAKEKQMGILAYSPLQRGLLTGKITPDYQFGEGDHRPGTPHFQPENLKRTNEFLAKIKPIAEEHDASLSQLVIAWTLRQPAMACALVGARNAQQTIENAKGGRLNLSEESLAKINRELANLELV
ncbi:aldo/keto reductase [Rapidithrix thailandica]|uniref:Aldo/keto reductase n=1 Tax=Rapidithrix thailandica TaxID=413964 RepID=A0AAW9S7M3_9BACT